MKLRAGDWVEVRSKQEILATLDKNGRLDEIPFMPQMFKYCGERFKVYKSAHKTCDTVNPIRSLRVADAVHLNLRCDGEAYGGCETGCLIFWKTAWLKPAKESRQSTSGSSDAIDQSNVLQSGACTEEDVWKGTRNKATDASAEISYVCQATQIPCIGTYLPWWDFRQYLEDYTSGNTTLSAIVGGFFFATYKSVINMGIGLGAPLRWIYDQFQYLWGGMPFPGKNGTIPANQRTPTCTLDLQPGELVRVKPYNEILSTINTEGKNHGLSFDAEMAPYCGGAYRVRTPVRRYINEKSGKLCTLNNVAVILDDVTCGARYSACRMLCPRSIYPWWREIWLERIPEENRTSK